MNKNQKADVISGLEEKLKKAQGLFLTDFSGITVLEETELRRDFRSAGVEYSVVKNTLLKKALEQVTGYDSIYTSLVGPTGVAFSYNDAIAPAKIIKKFKDKTQKLNCKACVVEMQVYPGNKLDELAKIPSRPELIASMLGSLQLPASGIVGTINAVVRELVSVIDAIEKKKAA
ncbi:MAG: 50S ribosomal protein L10 [Bacteroidetes bacterium]|nr:50S ribosomal protein L10 [Bacteroidota bacterium]